MADNVHKLADNLENIQERFMPNQVTMTIADPAANPGASQQFPTNAMAHKQTEDDKIRAIKMQTVNEEGVTPFGQLKASERDYQWLVRQKKIQEYAQFEQWFADNWDRIKPEEKEWARTTFPAFFSNRKKTLKKNIKNLQRLAEIKLEGLKSLEDVKLQYMVETGKVDMSPLADLLNPKKFTTAEKVATFRRGIFSPFRPSLQLSDQQMIVARAAYNGGRNQPGMTNMNVPFDSNFAVGRFPPVAADAN